MNNIVLIHGYGVDVDSPLRHAMPSHAGFSCFQSHLDSGEAVVYRWSEFCEMPLSQTFNPKNHLNIYLRERHKAELDTTHLDLQRFLKQHQPEIIVAHSLGTELLLNQLERNTLPVSVKRIVFHQGDLPFDRSIPEKASQSIEWINTFAPWDYTLAMSSLFHRKPRGGQIGWKQPKVTNRLFASFKHPHLHVSGLRDSKFLDLCLS